ncbi:MAG TPA: carboxypeptidase regulatory-like domain-containing protein [Steroidobacteraceae bacterium]|nr:carboxypeptidase regulatory-like domain-containing protein [Steroidobacteraceae bacterium]
MSDRRRSVRLAAAVSSILSAPAVAMGAGIALALAVAPLAQAQQTTSGVRGNVSQPDGSPAAGASVRVTDTRTGSVQRSTTSATGQFSMTGLRVGGPYTISVEAEGLAPQSITDVHLNLGDTYTFSVMLSARELEAVTVTAASLQTAQVALGPSVTFSLADLQDAPAINRNINDVISIDPRVYVDEAFNDSVQCGGASSRFNSLTVDGVRMNDNFGLNSNGFPTERMPFPYDAIEQVAVELAPFDVNYGGFTACNINAVTKSGTNEFHASAFYDYTDDSLSGDKLEGDPITLGSFEEKRYGFSVGGPILQDRLFFFAAYEKLDGANLFSRGTAESGAAVPVLGVNQAQLDRIIQIASDVYGYEIGDVPASLPNEDEKYLIKLDWEINESHRAAYTYTFNDGFNINESDDASNEFEFSDHFYERGAELTSQVAQLFSNWNENFSTEIRVSRAELDNRQISLGGGDFGEVQIRTFNDPDGAGPISPQFATVYFGGDDSRQSNKLKYDTTNYKLAGSYTVGDHVITGGWEREELDVFNLFIQHTEGEYRFDGFAQCSAADPDGCIDAFEAGRPDDVFYGNAAPSNIPSDGSASFGYEINTVYVQDEFPIADGAATIVAGLRYDWYTSGDAPRENPNFIARNGFPNTQTFDGEGLIQPRVGFNWDVLPALSIRGGVGLYSGGNPNVWLSNNYSNDGVTVVQSGIFDLENPANPSLHDLPHDGGGQPLFDIPQSLVDAVTTGTANSGVNALDPNFSIPKEWKYTIGATWDFDAGIFGDGYRMMLDYLHTEKDDSALIINANLELAGTGPDGRPLYRNIDRSNPACVNVDPFPAPLPAGCTNRNFNEDFILSNVPSADGDSDVWSVSLSKSHEWGLNWTLGYAFTESSDVNPMTSSVAFSNYVNVSVSDPNNPDVYRSNYNIKHRFTLLANYRKAFFGDYETKFTLYGRMNEGRPYSPVYTNGGDLFGDTLDFRHLIYVPTGPSDPNVEFGPGFDTAAFFDYLERNGLTRYAGGIAARNSLTSHWWNKFDIKVEQELPGFAPDHRFAAYFMIENVGNLINDDWGVLKEQGFPRRQTVVQIQEGLSPTGAYVYEQFFSPAPQARVSDPSLWELRFGIRYSF